MSDLVIAYQTFDRLIGRGWQSSLKSTPKTFPQYLVNLIDYFTTKEVL